LSDDRPSTEELQVVQQQRAEGERAAAERAPDPADATAHARRAERAAYLRDKLADQAEALGEDDRSR